MKLWDKNLTALSAPRFHDAYTCSASPDFRIDFRAYVCCWAAGHAERLAAISSNAASISPGCR
jgi:hypothetical protein